MQELTPALPCAGGLGFYTKTPKAYQAHLGFPPTLIGMTEIEGYRERGLRWRERQELDRIKGTREVDMASVRAQERVRASVVDEKLLSGHELARTAMDGLGRLNDHIRSGPINDPDYEYACRRLQESYARAAEHVIMRYITGR